MTDPVTLALPRLKTEEGYRQHYYKDTVGVLTIGYGTNLDEGLDEEEASWLLEHRARKKLAEIAGFAWFQGSGPVVQSVLVDLAYNLGTSGLLHFPKMLDAIAQKRWQVAHDELLASHYATQVGARAQVLAGLLLSGG
jgi:lysozyme